MGRVKVAAQTWLLRSSSRAQKRKKGRADFTALASGLHVGSEAHAPKCPEQHTHTHVTIISKK